MNRAQRLTVGRGAAVFLCGLLLSASAAPHQPLLVADLASFAGDHRLAPLSEEQACFASGVSTDPERPSASDALILPAQPREPLLKAEPARVVDFGPELALPAHQRLSWSSAPANRCMSGARHRPDRPACPASAGRKRR